MIPHRNWRGQFARGTYASGVNAGKLSDCPYYPPPAGCTPIEWPGERTTARHDTEKDGSIQNWFGGLVDGMRDASGQMYMRNRYYDPATGQFTQADPIGLAGGLNAYGFANGDPVSYSDPYGLSAQCCTLALRSGIVRMGIGIAMLDGPQPGPADLVALGTVAVVTGGVLLRNRHIEGRIEGEIGVIEEHFDKLSGSGPSGSGDPEDPRNRDKWKKDIQRHIREMGRQIDRLTGERNKAPWREQLRRYEERLRDTQ